VVLASAMVSELVCHSILSRKEISAIIILIYMSITKIVKLKGHSPRCLH
jgi:hypothetical protein